jgi:hypothetical protein
MQAGIFNAPNYPAHEVSYEEKDIGAHRLNYI